MHKTLLYIILVFLFARKVGGQNPNAGLTLSLSNTTYLSSEEQLPFWMWANQDGKVIESNSILNLTQAGFWGKHEFTESVTFVALGANLLSGIGNEETYYQANELFAKLNIRNWELNAGLYADDLEFDGLSSTNGNLASSRNARPHPKIGFRIADYKPVPFLGKFIFFKAEYEEGILNDERYVDKTRLHHKSLYFRLKVSDNLAIHTGLEHFVMWGGTSKSEKIGELPHDFSDYLRYITGTHGDENFLETDQVNVAGNQYGTYQFLLTRDFSSFTLSLNISHPFEDMSGLRFENYPDNLIGIDLKFKKEDQVISHILYEYTHTTQQSLWQDTTHVYDENLGRWRAYHTDHYYSHGIYRSGATYQQMMMASPFFSPLNVKDAYSLGPASNRFIAHHIGVKGQLSPQVYWTGKLSYIEHKGDRMQPFDPEHRQTSFLLYLKYVPKKVALDIHVAYTGDLLNTDENRMGLEMGLCYSFIKREEKARSRKSYLPWTK
ncbi:capsule assembly Wzi family protein [uncultured Draconibacterium sp.]|uniref:capsule assembly Wzi family protein n=1 Tax=uncultured Draconibacterium sp. TaxID=1573823 RepID=UPI003216AD2E